MRAIISLGFCIAAAVSAQPAPVRQFEVASIKPVPPDQPNNSSGVSSGKGRLTMNNVTLKRCIMGAWAIGPNQIQGGPAWIDSDRFEIVAKAEEKIDDDGVMMAMLKTLLADRFKLATHLETRPSQVYALEVAKGGPKLEKVQDGESNTSSGRGIIKATATDMVKLAELLSRLADAPVVNQTGLNGIFNFKLEWSPEADKPAKPGANGVLADNGISLYTAIQQQLGLRLRPQKATAEILVIDHVEKPTEN